MGFTDLTSRRTIISAVAAVSVSASFGKALDYQDATLIDLGRRFDELKCRFDHAEGSDEAYWSELESLCDLIVNTPAQSMKGLFVKARIAAWSRLGDLEQIDGPLDVQMSISILRDMIMQVDPSLYVPGALRKLVPTGD